MNYLITDEKKRQRPSFLGTFFFSVLISLQSVSQRKHACKYPQDTKDMIYSQCTFFINKLD